MIKINNYNYYTYDEIDNTSIMNELTTNSKSDFIHGIKERLLQSKNNSDIVFNNAYLVEHENNIVGYVYLSRQQHNNIYIEYLIIKDHRKKGHATNILDELIEYLFENNPDLESIHLSIDPSNIKSINVAEKLGFICDEDTYFDDKLDYILEKNSMYYR